MLFFVWPAGGFKDILICGTSGFLFLLMLNYSSHCQNLIQYLSKCLLAQENVLITSNVAYIMATRPLYIDQSVAKIFQLFAYYYSTAMLLTKGNFTTRDKKAYCVKLPHIFRKVRNVWTKHTNSPIRCEALIFRIVRSNSQKPAKMHINKIGTWQNWTNSGLPLEFNCWSSCWFCSISIDKMVTRLQARAQLNADTWWLWANTRVDVSCIELFFFCSLCIPIRAAFWCAWGRFRYVTTGANMFLSNKEELHII